MLWVVGGGCFYCESTYYFRAPSDKCWARKYYAKIALMVQLGSKQIFLCEAVQANAGRCKDDLRLQIKQQEQQSASQDHNRWFNIFAILLSQPWLNDLPIIFQLYEETSGLRKNIVLSRGIGGSQGSAIAILFRIILSDLLWNFL